MRWLGQVDTDPAAIPVQEAAMGRGELVADRDIGSTPVIAGHGQDGVPGLTGAGGRVAPDDIQASFHHFDGPCGCRGEHAE